MKYINLCLVCLSSLVIVGLKGQTPAYLHYDVGDGLPGNIVYCAAQDERGYMWFGTDKGLACFDGTRFLTYGVRDGLPDPEVLNLKLDSKGRMWIFCFKQKPCYRYNGLLHTEKNDPVLNSIEISSGVGDILEERNGSLWCFGQGRVLYKIKNDLTSFEKIQLTASVSYLKSSPEYMLGCDKKYFSKIDQSGNSTVLPLDTDMTKENYQGAGAIQNDNVLLSFLSGTYTLKVNKKECSVTQKILHTGGRVYIDPNKNIWICTTSEGAFRFSAADSDFKSPVNFLKDKKITIVFEDSGRGIWFCTAGEGVYYLPEKHSVFYSQNDGLINNNITALARYPDGGLLGGDDQGNVYSFKEKVQKLAAIGDGGLNRCRQIIPESQGRILVVSDYGLSFIGKNNTITPIRRSCKYVVTNDDGWLLGTATDLTFIPKDSLYNPQILSYRRSTTLTKDAQNFFWVGGINGLYSSKDNYQKNWGDIYPILKSRIITIKSDEKGDLWLATSSQSLIRLSTIDGEITGLEEITPHLSMEIDNIQSLFIEINGRVWLATNKGVFGFDKNYSVIHFDRNNGLAEDDVNDIIVMNDTLWAGTVAGLSKVIMSDNSSKGFPTYFTQLRYRLGDKKVNCFLQDTFSVHPVVQLPPGASLIEVDIAGLDYGSRGNMQYSCIINKMFPQKIYLWTLENIFFWFKNSFASGRDTVLISGNILNFGVYLPPARYEIKANAVNPNGVVSDTPAVWVIEKIPEWYQTIWFYLVLWGLGIYVIWRVIKTAFENRKLHTAVSELQLQALQSQINPHFIGNSINAIQQFFFPPDPIKASDYISIFTRLLRTTMDFSEKHFVTLQDEMAYIEDYLQMIHLRFGQRFHYSISISEGIALQTPVPTMLLQPILENATIHGLSPDETSILEISMVKTPGGLLTCTITDNGLGINHSKKLKNYSEGKHKSKGLALLGKKIKTLNELYGIGCMLEINDLSEHHKEVHGTQVVLSYYPEKVIKTDHRKP